MTKLIGALKPHMEVVSADGQLVGKVDHEDGQDRIKLTRDDAGEHRYLNWDWVERVSNGKLHLNLNKSGLHEQWKTNPSAHIR